MNSIKLFLGRWFVALCSLAAIHAWAAECCLTLPEYPQNEADSFIRTTFGPNPGIAGVPPESSAFTVDLLPEGGSLNSPVPPIAPGRYAAWCFDPQTDIDTGAYLGITGVTAGRYFGGFLFSSCDPDPNAAGGVNAFLPNRPNVKQSAEVWKRINYLINHRFDPCGSRVPTMWEVQNAIYKLFGFSPMPAPPYPTYDLGMIDCLVAKAVANAPGWTPVDGDKVAIIYVIDLAFNGNEWDNPVQLLFLEVPCEVPAPEPLVCDVSGGEIVCAGEPQTFTVSIEGGTAPYVISWSGPNSFVSTEETITVTNAGTYSVTITDSTPGTPLTTTCSADLVVTDGVPIFDNCPNDLDLGCNPDPSIIPSCNDPATITARDNHGSVTVSCTSSDTIEGCFRTRTITYTAVNECGIATCVQKITWREDTSAPVIECPPDVRIPNKEPKCEDKWCDHRDCKDKCSDKWCDHKYCKNDWDKFGILEAIIKFYFYSHYDKDYVTKSSSNGRDVSPETTGFATAADDCGDATVTYSDEIVPGDCDDAYKIVRTWTATDACGNVSTCTQNIFVGECKERCSGKDCDHKECKDKCSGHGCGHKDCKYKCKNKGCNYKECKDKCSGHGCDHKDCKYKCYSKSCNYKECKDKCSGHGCGHKDCKYKCYSKSCNYKECKDKCSGHGCDHKDCKNKCYSKGCNYKECKDRCSGHGCDHKDCKYKCKSKNCKICKDKCSGHGCDHKDCKNKCSSKKCEYKDCKDKCSGRGCDHKDCKNKCSGKWCDHKECKSHSWWR